mmetsp:Transcript_77941/g.242789  ORF Transcript_77941/g.242789 Transcript_77941/m.242789 type:complete len:131 (+) Transcript_77941:2-394(+)
MALRALVLFALLGAAAARRHRLHVGRLERKAAPVGEEQTAAPPPDCYCHGCDEGKKCEADVKACPDQDMYVYMNITAAEGIRRTKCGTACKRGEFKEFCLFSAESRCWDVSKFTKTVPVPEQPRTCTLGS